jgi:hypothetical protein
MAASYIKPPLVCDEHGHAFMVAGFGLFACSRPGAGAGRGPFGTGFGLGAGGDGHGGCRCIELEFTRW